MDGNFEITLGRQPGLVSIVGAGPGDPELLTVKAINRIRFAELIFHDALVPEAIRRLFPPNAWVFDVGKRAMNPLSSQQEEIHARMARAALQGSSVLRLKGGDPFVFGRGGEELQYLQDRGIPVEVIPGISSVTAAAVAASIPLTHRKVSRAFTVMAAQADLLDEIDWPALIATGGTWVFLMAKSAVCLIAGQLLAHGADPKLPMAVVENASLPDQVVTRKSLASFANEGFVGRTDGPGLVMAGETVSLFSNPFMKEINDAGTLSALSQNAG